jgi:hypothetical protein
MHTHTCLPSFEGRKPKCVYASVCLSNEASKLMSELTFYMRLLTLDKPVLIRLLSVLTLNFRRC